MAPNRQSLTDNCPTCDQLRDGRQCIHSPHKTFCRCYKDYLRGTISWETSSGQPVGITLRLLVEPLSNTTQPRLTACSSVERPLYHNSEEPQPGARVLGLTDCGSLVRFPNISQHDWKQFTLTGEIRKPAGQVVGGEWIVLKYDWSTPPYS